MLRSYVWHMYFMHGAIPGHAYGGASKHVNAADVGEVNVHGNATDDAAVTG